MTLSLAHTPSWVLRTDWPRGAEEDVLLWKSSCNNSLCEYYSVGDGYCLMRTGAVVFRLWIGSFQVAC